MTALKLPSMFQDIIDNDKKREELRDNMTQSAWRKLRELVADRRILRTAAKRALSRDPNRRYVA